jgi:hypothetical protein
LGDGQIHAIIPAMVLIEHGPYGIVQVPDPVIEYPEGLDPQLLGAVGLRLLGLSPKEAERISRSIDWASTLVLPIPSWEASVTETMVAGAEALILSPVDRESGKVLVFEKSGVIYAVMGQTGNTSLVEIAESLF